MDQITEAVNRAVLALGESIRERPFLHRVEHSLHCELYILIQKELESLPDHDRFVMTKDGFETQLIHKEWPHQDGIDDSPRRGNYDLVVLDRNSLAGCTEDAYREGRNIAIHSVFELGMNYDTRHLLKDCETLRKTKAANKWIIHFRNVASRKSEVEKHEKFIERLARERGEISFQYLWMNKTGSRISAVGDITVVRHGAPASRP